ncbi:MAG TPA: phosphatase PAP2 family protein [Elusimicrobiota bacterium]|nr:phosphatase PAP2 family protein [Elusimicrobiota bacterium]HNI57693.1 phosphatase PAP2 family protein [Elusimicrobiota bacterium]
MGVLRRSILTALLLSPLGAGRLRAGENPPAGAVANGYAYARPGLWTWLKRQVGDQKEFWVRSSRREQWPLLGIVTVSTLWLTARDQYLYEKGYQLGDQWGVSHDGVQRTFFKTKLWPTNYVVRLNGPYDLGTGLYFLGDGMTHFTVAGSFLAYGLAKDDSRALQTSSQLVEGIVANGFLVQVLKHATGRENPNTGTAKNGKWRLFPNQKDYAKHVNKYDAFPSGHLATAMVTVTVISENYPEYRWIRPLGYTLMTGLAYEMVNNGVHWVSDYPLAIYMGYTFGRIAVHHGRTPLGAWEIKPLWTGSAAGLRMVHRFGGRTRRTGGSAAEATR